ncbi:MAG: hypothetical protein R2765_06715 [Ferruginibacter sp.]
MNAYAQSVDSAFHILENLQDVKTGLDISNHLYESSAVKDSAQIVNGNFSFNGFVQTLKSLSLTLKG